MTMASEAPIRSSVVAESTPAGLVEPCRQILAALAEKGFSQDDIFAVHLALEEAFLNAVKHGNKTHPWQIDAISGATISSAAIGRMINTSGQRMFPLIQRHLAELEARGTAADTASRTGTGDN